MEFLLGVASSIVASVVLLFIARARNWLVFGNALKRWHLARRLDDIGMTNFFASRADYSRYRPPGNIADYLRTAKHRIDIAAYWMGHGNESESTPAKIVEMLEKNSGLTVRIAMIDPNGKYVGAVSEYLGIPVNELRARLTASLENLSAARAAAAKNVQGRLSVLTYSQMPAASVIMLDYGADEGARIQLDFKPYQRPRSESFAMELTAPGRLYTTCSEAWIKLIDMAEPYVSVNHSEIA